MTVMEKGSGANTWALLLIAVYTGFYGLKGYIYEIFMETILRILHRVSGFFAFRAFEEFILDNPWWMLYAFFTACYIVMLFDRD